MISCQAETVMKRLIASLSHQSVPIEGIKFLKIKRFFKNLFSSLPPPGTLQPVGRNFPKLRGGTMTSCLKFCMNIYDIVQAADREVADSGKSAKMRQILDSGGFPPNNNSLAAAAATPTSSAAAPTTSSSSSAKTNGELASTTTATARPKTNGEVK